MDDFAIGYLIHRFFYRIFDFFHHWYRDGLRVLGCRLGSTSKASTELVFDDPRLHMTIAGRFFVRVTSYVVSLFLFAAMVTFLISDITPLFFAGLLLALFFIDQAVHRGEGDVSMAELPATGKINVACLMVPRAFSLIEKSFDHALLTQQDFFLLVADQLVANPQIGAALWRLDVQPKELRQKLNVLLDEKREGGVSNLESSAKASVLALRAFDSAVTAGHDFIKPTDLFAALVRVDDQVLRRLFGMFSITVEDLEIAFILSSAIRRRSDFASTIEAMPMSEVNDFAAEKVLAYQSLPLERETGIMISFAAIKRAVIVTKKDCPDIFSPTRAKDLLKRALVSAEQRGERTLGSDRIIAVAEAPDL